IALALWAGGIGLAEMVANPLARVAAAVEHDQHQPDRAGQRGPEADRLQRARPLAVLIDVDRVRLAVDPFLLVVVGGGWCLVHVAARRREPWCYNATDAARTPEGRHHQGNAEAPPRALAPRAGARRGHRRRPRAPLPRRR